MMIYIQCNFCYIWNVFWLSTLCHYIQCVKSFRLQSYSGPYFFRIFRHLDWIWRDTEYPNAEKCRYIHVCTKSVFDDIDDTVCRKIFFRFQHDGMKKNATEFKFFVSIFSIKNKMAALWKRQNMKREWVPIPCLLKYFFRVDFNVQK